ncbi:MAG: hypothetical protein OXG15_02425 [Gammaproteobacteria bacterium]|nr:hypothetical protein [Gammaproteobacteria bacterium]
MTDNTPELIVDLVDWRLYHEPWYRKVVAINDDNCFHVVLEDQCEQFIKRILDSALADHNKITAIAELTRLFCESVGLYET